MILTLFIQKTVLTGFYEKVHASLVAQGIPCSLVTCLQQQAVVGAGEFTLTRTGCSSVLQRHAVQLSLFSIQA